MSDEFDELFGDAAHDAFVSVGLSAYDDATHRGACTGTETTPVRVLVDRDVEFAGDRTQVPQRVTLLQVMRADLADAQPEDTFRSGNFIWTVDTPVQAVGGPYDTYIVIEARA